MSCGLISVGGIGGSGGGGSGITSINGATGPAVALVGVSGINIIPSGNSILISGEGVQGTGTSTSGAGCFSEAFTDTRDTTFTHSLGTTAVIVQVQNISDEVIVPDKITAVDANSTRVQFNRPETGTVIIIGCATSGTMATRFAADFTSVREVTFVHGLSTLDVLVQVRDAGTPPQEIVPDKISWDTINEVTLFFNRSQSGRVVIL